MKDSSATKDLTLKIESPGMHTILFGDAEKISYPKPINIRGVLSSPANFLKGKSSVYNSKDAHLLIDRDKNTVTLNIDERSEKSPIQIVGELKPSEDLKDWGINSSQLWSVQEFLKFIRERKFFFADAVAHGKLIASLQKWTIGVEVAIKQHNDNSGNSLFQLEQKVNALELIKDFDLNIPIYKGYPSRTFKVYIGFKPTNTQVDMYLFSDELFFLTRNDRENLFDEEIKAFDALNFRCSVIYVS